MRIKDEVGNKYGRYLVVKFSHINRHRKAIWECVCDCGEVRVVCGNNLRSGISRSCGCLKIETTVKLMKGVNKSKEHKKNMSMNHANVNGENNPNWKGGITCDRHKDINSNEYKNWRISIFKRDNYKCQACDDGSNKLIPHHIARWSDYPFMRYLIYNGITLCKKCHYKTINKEHKFHREFFNITLNKENIK
jgi:hypothetical protein